MGKMKMKPPGKNKKRKKNGKKKSILGIMKIFKRHNIEMFFFIIIIYFAPHATKQGVVSFNTRPNKGFFQCGPSTKVGVFDTVDQQGEVRRMWCRMKKLGPSGPLNEQFLNLRSEKIFRKLIKS